jgi:hypothetical protein
MILNRRPVDVRGVAASVAHGDQQTVIQKALDVRLC